MIKLGLKVCPFHGAPLQRTGSWTNEPIFDMDFSFQTNFYVHLGPTV